MRSVYGALAFCMIIHGSLDMNTQCLQHESVVLQPELFGEMYIALHIMLSISDQRCDLYFSQDVLNGEAGTTDVGSVGLLLSNRQWH